MASCRIESWRKGMVCRNEKGQFTAKTSPSPSPTPAPKPTLTKADKKLLQEVRRRTDELEAEWKNLEKQYERLSWELRNDVATVQGAEIVGRKMRELEPKIKLAEYAYMGQRRKLMKLREELGIS